MSEVGEREAHTQRRAVAFFRGALGGSRTLYNANREVYGLLRYGVKVRPDVGEQTATIRPIDWKNPGNNDFAIRHQGSDCGREVDR